MNNVAILKAILNGNAFSKASQIEELILTCNLAGIYTLAEQGYAQIISEVVNQTADYIINNVIFKFFGKTYHYEFFRNELVLEDWFQEVTEIKC